MITKAQIKKIIPPNKFAVYIPIFNDGNSENSMNNFAIREATLCTLPGASNAFSEGDIVYVGFEDNDANRPVILGYLYGSNYNINPALQVSSLKVMDKTGNNAAGATLSENTAIGNLTYQDLTKMWIFYKSFPEGFNPSSLQ